MTNRQAYIALHIVSSNCCCLTSEHQHIDYFSKNSATVPVENQKKNLKINKDLSFKMNDEVMLSPDLRLQRDFILQATFNSI